MSLLVQLLQQTAQRYPDHPAIIQHSEDQAHHLTFARLLEQVKRLAGALSEAGIQSGDRVALLFSNQQEYLISLLGVLQAGAVVVPLNLQAPMDDLVYVVQHSGTRLILATHGLVEKMPAGYPLPMWVSNSPMHQEGRVSFEQKLVESEPQTVVYRTLNAKNNCNSKPGNPAVMRLLIYTSGTTGNPKGVMLSEENLLANLDGIEPVFEFSEADRLLLALPLFHAFGLIIALLAVRFGATVILAPGFTPKALLQALSQHQITVLPLVPTMFSLLLHAAEKQGQDTLRAMLGSLRFCISGGAGLPPQLHQALQTQLGVTVLEGYGLTEASPVVAVNRLERGPIQGSVGKPLDNVTLKIAQDGEVWVRGDNVMLGYYQNPEETAASIQTEETGERWLKTGDLGHCDAEGNLYLSEGRKKDLIIKAGENLAPVKIEQVFYQHPAVMEASVIGMLDERLGERVLACVQLKPEQQISEQELLHFCRDHLPAFWVPDGIRFYEELPKTPAGKILKKVLRQENQTVWV